MIDEKKLYKEAVDKWGFDAQIDMAIEDCLELALALKHYKRGRCKTDKVIEEATDVIIRIMQLQSIFLERTKWLRWKRVKLQNLADKVYED